MEEKMKYFYNIAAIFLVLVAAYFVIKFTFKVALASFSALWNLIFK